MSNEIIFIICAQKNDLSITQNLQMVICYGLLRIVAVQIVLNSVNLGFYTQHSFVVLTKS